MPLICAVLGCDGAVEDRGAPGGDGVSGAPWLALVLPHRRRLLQDASHAHGGGGVSSELLHPRV